MKYNCKECGEEHETNPESDKCALEYERTFGRPPYTAENLLCNRCWGEYVDYMNGRGEKFKADMAELFKK